MDAAHRIRAQSFLIDGEAVICREDGISDFNALRRTDHDVMLVAFEVLELEGEDLRDHLLEQRKQRLAKMLAPDCVAIAYKPVPFKIF